MSKQYENLLKEEMQFEIVRRKAGFPKRSLPQMENAVISEINNVDFWTCNCRLEYGDHETEKIMKCSCCGRMMCPNCEDQHGPLKFNRDRFGLCFKERKK